ncbi:MAG: bifunctional riboflavin kinase/FAD synthetase [Saprospiraceae bacterium]
MRVFTDLNELPVFRKAVVTIGSFDGVHAGHRRLLEKVQALARASGGESVVITFDPHPRTVLRPDDPGFRLLTTTAEKIGLLADCGIDNVVVVPFNTDFAQLTAEQYVEDFLVKKFNPAHIIIGYDHRFGNNRSGNLEFLKNYAPAAGFQVEEIPAHEVDDIAVSSSKIRKALDSADILRANRLLGHPYSFSGKVIEGKQIGRTIGFPTANIAIDDPYKLILPAGIYAAQVILPPHFQLRGKPGQEADAMLYIGDRPTLEQAGPPVIEVNILDFQGDLYGENLTVHVLDFIRPDRKLDGLAALQAQIAADQVAIEKRLQEMAETKPSPSSDVAIVILNYNTRRHLAAYLPSVIAHSAGARIIVADNGSPDDSVAFLRAEYPQVEVLDLGRNYGFAQGYNEALRQVQAGIYVILNSDVEVAPDWLEPVLAAMEADPGIGIAQPKILAWTDKTRFEYAGAAGGWIDTLGYPFCRGRIFLHSEEDLGQYDQPQACFWAAGAAFFIRAELYHTFDGFDGDYFAHNEEIDLCWRIKRAGYSVWCIPQSVVYHLGGGTQDYQSPRKVFLNFRNSLYTLLKNESASKLLWLLPARFLLDGLAGARFAAKGQFRAIWAIVRAHFSFYGSFGTTWRKRRQMARIIEKHRIGPADKAGIFPGSIVFSHYARRIKEFSQLW